MMGYHHLIAYHLPEYNVENPGVKVVKTVVIARHWSQSHICFREYYNRPSRSPFLDDVYLKHFSSLTPRRY